jgi:hypothetical protein
MSVHKKREEFFRGRLWLPIMLGIIIFIGSLLYGFVAEDLMLSLIGLILEVIPIAIFYLWYSRYREYLLWRQCLTERFGDEKAEEGYYFGFFPINWNVGGSLGKKIRRWGVINDEVFQYENGLLGPFKFTGDIHLEAKRWSDIERISVIPYRSKKYPYWFKVESKDLKVCGFPATTKERELLWEEFEKAGKYGQLFPVLEGKNEGLYEHIHLKQIITKVKVKKHASKVQL